MSIKIGRAKHQSKMTIEDYLRHPIWVSAHDDRHDEEWYKPVDSTEGVSTQVLRIEVPIITLRIVGTELFASGYYDRANDRLFCIAFHVSGRWRQPSELHGITFPLELESLPPILGREGVRFVLAGPDADCAPRAA